MFYHGHRGKKLNYKKSLHIRRDSVGHNFIKSCDFQHFQNAIDEYFSPGHRKKVVFVFFFTSVCYNTRGFTPIPPISIRILYPALFFLFFFFFTLQRKWEHWCLRKIPTCLIGQFFFDVYYSFQISFLVITEDKYRYPISSTKTTALYILIFLQYFVSTLALLIFQSMFPCALKKLPH